MSLASNEAKLPTKANVKKKHPTRKEQRQASKAGAGVSQKALDLFDI
jgi:hypothetical protein